jgi:hypothetical protein
MHLVWRNRSYDNLVDKRKAELRIMAQTQIAAIEQRAIVEIETSCLEAQTQIAIAGLTSDAARAFVDHLPGVEANRRLGGGCVPTRRGHHPTCPLWRCRRTQLSMRQRAHEARAVLRRLRRPRVPTRELEAGAMKTRVIG